MILYHGTDANNLDSILKNGLLGRKHTGKQVFDGNLESNENFTYLTWFNPVAHAYSANEFSPAILKVDVDEKVLYPDEDFIERLIFMKTGVPGNPKEIDITQYKDLWEKSLKMFGNVAIPEVHPEQILDHITLDPSDFEYHCGLGAQGNQMHDDLENRLNILDISIPRKYAKRLEILFTSGWAEVKKDILKERPSLTLSLPKPTEKMRVKGKKLGVIFKPNPSLGLNNYICDEWVDNFPIVFSGKDPRFSKLVQVQN